MTTATTEFVKTACPHDCPSACSLEVERISPTQIGVVRGAKDNSYTSGVVCAKVANYRERTHHPDRLSQPLRRIGAKGSGEFAPITWDQALDEIAERFTHAAQRHGAQTVWPYHSGGTMGLIQRHGIDRFRHAMGYSRQHTTICITPANSGWMAGVGRMDGVDPREMDDSDLIVVWGGNPVSTQVNVMTHVSRARKKGAKLVVVDVYRTPTVAVADEAFIIRPGSDAALACAMMNVLLAEGLADRAYMAKHTDFDADVEAHLATRTPEWAAPITGLSADRIRAFARMFGATRKSFLRVGFGFTRSRNGAANMHAVSCLSAITGAWQVHGGGAFFVKNDWVLDMTLAWGLDMMDPSTRILDQSRIGPILCGFEEDLKGGPPVTAMIMQNANSANVAADSQLVRRGLSREDLFVCVHEQFMTATAKYADILLPAATFLEYDDIYKGLGHTHLTMAPRVLDRYADTRTNHEVICALAKRLGCTQPSFDMRADELLDATLRASGHAGYAEACAVGWIDCAGSFERAHFLDGFGQTDKRFHFQPDWEKIGPLHAVMPKMPDYLDNIELPDATHPFRMVAPPARTFLNTSFSETPSSRKREGKPRALLHPDDCAVLGVESGGTVRIGNARGEVRIELKAFADVQPGVVIVEGIWPNADFDGGGLGINQLIGAQTVPPNGGSAFHDTAVWVRALCGVPATR